ncbi:helix-turn-helix domain-containing protein [Saccharopolyspora gloriosae]|uniref:helix-turn-helix domain-containing protein n=1 Tax=Saccharopolyspora gloriosae TaxID=455344 RepID=UPI00160A0824|nr:helix-turn-helix domain-containing protein [Saccharopolyspora gloriosae]
MTAEEVARRLAVGRTAVFALIKSGELATVLIGRSRRVPTEALDEYVRTLRSRAE